MSMHVIIAYYRRKRLRAARPASQKPAPAPCSRWFAVAAAAGLLDEVRMTLAPAVWDITLGN